MLEEEQVVLREGVGFGDNGDEVDTGSETLHDFDVQGFQSMQKSKYKKKY